VDGANVNARGRCAGRHTVPPVSCQRARLPLILGAAAFLVACGGGSPSVATPTPQRSSTPAGQSSSTSTSTSAAPTPSPTPDPCAVASQSPPTATLAANYPTALAFAPDGRLFFTERSGTVRVWQGGATRAFASVSTVTTERGGGYSERGLLGIAISPTFASDRFVYAFYSDVNYTQQHVIRWADCGGTGTNGTVIITLPSGPDCCHKGGRLAFGTDGMLYVTLGEEHTPTASQDTSDVRGKVLRYRPDGSVPADNPFGAGNPVWAYGFRNPFGLAISRTGQMAITDNGPSGDAGSPSTGYDIVFNNVLRGGAYPWAYCYGYSHPKPPNSNCGSGRTAPDWSSETSTVVPTGATFVDSSGPAGYAGHLVFCTFGSGGFVLTPGSPHASVSAGPAACRLDIIQGPDHAVYYSDTQSIHRLG